MRKRLRSIFSLLLFQFYSLWNHLNSWGLFSRFVKFLQVRGDVISWIGCLGKSGRGEWLKGKITPRKMILFETSYLSLKWLMKSLNDDDAGIAAQVDLKTSTLKPLHANWVINNYNLILNAQN